MKLTDFSFSMFSHDIKETKYLQGIQYRAPEVILEYPLSTAADMYSFGVILTEFYSGRPLFDGDKLNETHKLALVMEVFGRPPDKLLSHDKARRSHIFFGEFLKDIIKEIGIT